MKAAAVIAVCLVLAALLGWALWDHFAQQGATHQLANAVRAEGTATVDAGQAKAEADAGRIVAAGEARVHADLTIHQENSRAILSAPGADAPVDPRPLDVARRGLCRHPAYRDDPQCAGLLEGDPGLVPDRSGGGSPY